MARRRPGAFVISLDFEMHWGIFDLEGTDGPYSPNIRAEWEVVPALLDLFQEHDIAATWAAVGLLFARSREHAEQRWPAELPPYADPALRARRVPVGEGEAADPFHYAPSLIQRIARTPRQEIASHTFQHYYCLEPGWSVESFRADLRAAAAIAQDYGHRLRSIVFPRNQVNPALLPLLSEYGIVAYRGEDPHWMYRGNSMRPAHRLARLADRYVNISGHNLTRWSDIRVEDGLCNVPSTRYLQAYTGDKNWERLRLKWIQGAIRHAARTGSIVHLWWHPHDFGASTDACMAMLRAILRTVGECRSSHGLRSMTMAEVAEAALSE